MLRKLRLWQKNVHGENKVHSTNRHSDPCILLCTFKTYYLKGI